MTNTQNKTAVFLAYGDSRMKFSKKPFTTPHHNVLAWQPSTQQIVLATEENIEGISYSPNRSGFIVDFGKLYHEKTGENVLIVPAYQGGSGFQNDGWQENGSLYVEALSRFNSAYEKAYNPYFAGAIGSIGSNNVATVVVVEEIPVNYNQHFADFTSYGLPAPDGKFYFSCLEATNQHGTSMYITSPSESYHHI